MNNQKNYIFKNIFFAILSNLITLGASGLTILLIPQVLSVSDFGYLQMYIFYAGYLGLFQIGWVDGLYLKLGGMFYEDLDKIEIRLQYKIFKICTIIIATFLIMISFLCIKEIQKKIVFCTVSFCVIPYLNRNFWDNILICTGEMKKYARSCCIDKSCYLLFIGFLLLIGCNDILYYITADITGKCLGWLSSRNACRDILAQHTVALNVKSIIPEILSNISAGINLLISNISSMLIVGIFRIFIEHAWNIEVYSQMSFTLNISNFILVFISAVSQVFFTLLRRITADAKMKIYISLKEIIAILTFGLCLIYWPMKSILTLFLPEYAFGLKYMAVLLPVCFFECKWSLLTQTYLKAMREERRILMINITALILSLLLASVSVLLLKDLLVAVTSILLTLGFRSVLGEFTLCQILNIKIMKSTLKECLLVILFIIISWNFNPLTAIFTFTFIYAIYLVAEKKYVQEFVNVILKSLKK